MAYLGRGACACPGGCGRPWRGGAVSGRRSHGHRPAAGRCGGQRPCGAAELVSLVGCGTPDASEWPGAVGWGRAGLRMGVVAATFCSGGRRSDGDRWIIRHLRDAEEGGTGSPVVGYDLPLQQLPVRTYHRGGGCRSGADSGGASALAGHGGPGGRGAGHDGGQWHLGNRLAPTL